MFHAICGGPEEYEALAIDDETDDIIVLHSRVKRGLEGKARAEEAQAEKTRAEYQATRATFEDLDLEAPHDAGGLGLAQEQAASNLATMKAHNGHAQHVAEQVAEAGRRLDELAAQSDDAEALRRMAAGCRDLASDSDTKAAELQDRIDELTTGVRMAKAESVRLRQKAKEHDAQAERADQQAATRAVLAQDAARSVPAVYTQEQLDAAEAAVAAARAAVEQGAVIRRAREQEAKATVLHDQAKAHAKRGQLFRDRAGSLDAVISSVLPPGCPLRYENGRLVLATDRGPREPYSDLSHGERWKVAIDFVAPIINQDGRKGLLPLPQEAYEALDDDNKALLAKLARDNKLIILTARATRGPLTATVIEGNGKID